MIMRRTRAAQRRSALRQSRLEIARVPAAITCSPRPRHTLAEVLAAWPASGLRTPRLVIDGPLPIPPGYEATVRSPAIGAWPTWLAALRELVDREPRAGGYLICQDDAVPSRNLAPYLEATLPTGAEVLSLCTVDRYARDSGWRAHEEDFAMAGAQALLFTAEAARDLLTDAPSARYRWNPAAALERGWARADGLTHIDGVIGDWCRRTGRPMWRHTPSLVGHVGERYTTIHPGKPAAPSRTTQNWRGAEFDCLTHLTSGGPRLLSRRVVGAGEHRSGWPRVMEAISRRSSGSGLLLDDFVDASFSYQQIDAPHRQPWVGIFHHPVTVHSPWKWDAPMHLRGIARAPHFAASIPQLRGAIGLTREVADDLHAWLGVPTLAILHPTETDVPPWSEEAGREHRCVAQVGYCLRNTRAIHQFAAPPGWRRLRVTANHRWYGRRDAGLRELRVRPETAREEVEERDRLVDGEYDALLARGVVLTELYGASANNLVVECMVRGTPLLVNRLPAVEEYLGRDYPLFYERLEEAGALLEFSRLVEASAHLRERARLLPSFDEFAAQVVEFVVACGEAP